jgi:hypothetical protein
VQNEKFTFEIDSENAFGGGGGVGAAAAVAVTIHSVFSTESNCYVNLKQ